MIQYYPLFLSVIGWILIVGGIGFSAMSIQFLIKGQSTLGDTAPLHYFVAFSASMLVVWGLIMITAEKAGFAEYIALPSAVGFALMSIWRVPLSRHPGIIESLGKGPAIEVPVFGLIAILFGIVALS